MNIHEYPGKYFNISLYYSIIVRITKNARGLSFENNLLIAPIVSFNRSSGEGDFPAFDPRRKPLIPGLRAFMGFRWPTVSQTIPRLKKKAGGYHIRPPALP